MTPERLDIWCEKGILAVILGILCYGPLAFGAVRPSEFLVLQGLGMGLAALWLLRLAINPRLHILCPPVVWGVAAFTVYAVIRYFFADVEYVARKESVRVLLYAVIFLVCLSNVYRQESIRLLVYALILLGIVEASLAVFQFTTHMPKVWSMLRPSGYLSRGSGTFMCPNHLAGFLEMILPLALAYTVGSGVKPLARVFLGYGAIVLAAGVVFSVSRAGWAAALIGLIFLLALLARTSRHWLALAVFVVLLVGAGLFVYSRSVKLRARVNEMERSLVVAKDYVRYGYAAAAYRMWTDHPWFGVGPAHYDLRYRNYRAENWVLNGRPGRAHCDYLNTLADWGIIGGLLVGIPFVLVGWGLARHWHHLRRVKTGGSRNSGGIFPFLGGASAGLVAILVHSAGDFNMHIPSNAILMVVLLALLASHIRFATDRHWTTPKGAGRLAACLSLLAILGFLGWEGWRSAQENLWLRRARTHPIPCLERIEALKRAFQVEPRNADTAYLVGEQYRLLSWQGGDDYRELATQAIEWFKKAAALNPWDGLNPLGIGSCLDWLGRHQEAEGWLRKALQLDPNGYFARAVMGWHYVQIEDYDTAIQWFTKSIEMNNYDNPFAYTYRSMATNKLKEKRAPAGRAP